MGTINIMYVYGNVRYIYINIIYTCVKNLKITYINL